MLEGMAHTTSRYVEPGTFTRRVFNPLVAALTKLGVSVNLGEIRL